jgi:hypothetical protein
VNKPTAGPGPIVTTSAPVVEEPAQAPPAADPAAPATAAVPPAGADRAAADAPAARSRRAPVADLAALATYLAGALVLTGRFWVDVPRRVPANWLGDRALAEWNLAFAARVVSHLENPFFTTRMNAPAGVNTMANTSVLGVGVPVSPITLLFGPAAAFDTVAVASLAGTALAWYYVLSRHLVGSRAAAWVGGLVGGFAPSVAAHASWHPHLVPQFLVPLIAWRVVRLREPGRWLRNGIVLGLLIVWQAFIGEEVLFLTALGCGLFVAVYAATHRHEVPGWARPFLSGLGVAASVAAVLLAYPLWSQFRGPGSYHGIVSHFAGLRIDVLGYTSFASNSVVHQLDVYGPRPALEAEDNSNLGWPLVLVVVAVAVWLWRETAVRAAAVTAATFAVLSFGPELVVDGRHTGVPGPWRLLQNVPVFNLALPIRCGLVVTPLAGLILAYGLDRLRHLRLPAVAEGSPGWSPAGSPRLARALLLGGVLAAVLVPMAPLPVSAVDRPATPRFVSSGAWRQYVGPQDSVLVLPTPSFTGLWWSAQTGLDLRLSHGYFLGPGAAGRAVTGPPPRPTDDVLIRATRSGEVPALTDADRANARADFAYWRTAIVLLRPDPRVPDALRRTLDALIGPGRFVDGVWLWDVRDQR